MLKGAVAMPGHQVSEQKALFVQARRLIHRSIREWYPGELFLIVMPDKFHPGSPRIRISSWSESVTELAIQLNDLSEQLDDDFTLEEVIPEARQLVAAATKTLWPGMRHLPLPLAPGLTIPEEFTTYRLGAYELVAQLAHMKEQCLMVDFGLVTEAGNAQLPPPSPMVAEAGNVQLPPLSPGVVEGIIVEPSEHHVNRPT
jgi:hypothetical protein